MQLFCLVFVVKSVIYKSIKYCPPLLLIINTKTLPIPIKFIVMNRQEVYHEIKGMFGMVPTFIAKLPDDTLELEWTLFKKISVEEKVIPNKYKELIGLGISATSKCQYCLFFHTQMAILFGATPEEIEEAIHYAKNTAGWSAYINGLQLDMKQFKKEITNMCAFVQEAHKAEHI